MVKGMLIEFYKNNNRIKPEHILFYRDGVSEGQFQKVSVCIPYNYIPYKCVQLCHNPLEKTVTVIELWPSYTYTS